MTFKENGASREYVALNTALEKITRPLHQEDGSSYPEERHPC